MSRPSTSGAAAASHQVMARQEAEANLHQLFEEYWVQWLSTFPRAACDEGVVKAVEFVLGRGMLDRSLASRPPTVEAAQEVLMASLIIYERRRTRLRERGEREKREKTKKRQDVLRYLGALNGGSVSSWRRCRSLRVGLVVGPYVCHVILPLDTPPTQPLPRKRGTSFPTIRVCVDGNRRWLKKNADSDEDGVLLSPPLPEECQSYPLLLACSYLDSTFYFEESQND
ncbi:unnamed protein product [Pylaiella littoralis]